MTLIQSALLELTEAMCTADDGAGMHEQNETRTTQRNGSRTKVVSTTSGDLSVKIAKTRTGSFFPTLLHPRRRIDVVLPAVVMEAYVRGVSTRKVDDLVVAMGAEAGISKSEVSRICAELDVEVAAFTGCDLSARAFPTCSSTRPTARPASAATRLEWVPGGVPGGRHRHGCVRGRAP